MAIRSVGVLGGGAWGTALAHLAAGGGATVLWAREPEVVDGINAMRENATFLPGIALDASLRATGDMAEASAADAVLLAAPAQHLRSVTAAAAPHIANGTPVAICAKGIERGSNALLSTVVSETLPHCVPAVLSGPTFAHEVARGLPTAVTLACADRATGEALAQRIGTPAFRPYLSRDVIGAQIGGALKNVLAIAAGIVSGRALGENARAAIITRGMAEMLRVGRALGAEPATLMGLSGLGDLVLTCSSANSRNHALGIALAQGASAEDHLGSRRSVAEGAYTAAAAVEIAEAHGIDLPICHAVHAILNRDVDIDAAIADLLSRPLREETA